MIHNAAALVVEVASGHVLAYAGNSTLSDTTGRHGRDVDMIMAPRSTGSIMKPFLYAGLLSSGMMLPNALIADIPTRFQGFRPENSDFTYSGAVPAGDALARSLNIPAVRMLQMLEEERFLNQLHRMGFTTFDKPASHYGLSLILGGGEATLWELAGAYASMARELTGNHGGWQHAGGGSGSIGNQCSSAVEGRALRNDPVGHFSDTARLQVEDKSSSRS
ncbi:MAG: penicillin-binding transpeptidase domain-containing protein [Marinilabiliales bacterium]|nr:penicillin-binding transpeptidase domain-containing protein [Marinilabiliales bacterium]